MRIHPRFMRSVLLERDAQDPNSSLGYLLTPVAQGAITRLGSAFAPKSTQRAWRVTGDYGSGKTDFALALSRLVSGNREQLPNSMRGLLPRGTNFKTALATGDAEPLGTTILRAIGKKVDGRTSLSTQSIITSVSDAVARARKDGHQGLVLIIDELGKNLEFAARHPDFADVFLLQRLAEEAARSGESALVTIVILHQGIAAYSTGLDMAARREWDKVAGRFDEIVFAQPLGQVSALVRATLNIDVSKMPADWVAASNVAMKGAVRSGLYGTGTGKNEFESFGPGLFPLHPTVVPVIVRAMRKLGQNERSLFSFLASAEPFALQDHSRKHPSPSDADPFYRIHHFFDFAQQNLAGFQSSSAGTSPMWGVVDEVIASVKVSSQPETNILKTIGMLSLLDSSDIVATRDVVLLAIGGDEKEGKQAFNALQKRGIIYERGMVKGFCLWPHTSVNLDDAFERATEAVSVETVDTSVLCRHLTSEALVPRFYYAETGTLRYATVTVLPYADLSSAISFNPLLHARHADMHVSLVIPKDEAEKRRAIATLNDRYNEIPDGQVVCVAEPVPDAVSALNELLAWEWVRDNTPQLSGDRFAREELRRQLEQAKRALRSKLNGLDDLGIPGSTQLISCFTLHGGQQMSHGRPMLTFIGEQFKVLYPKTPRVFNELINRKNPSAAAVSARTKLAQAMVESPHLPILGMNEEKRPAEMALYLSILKNGGFHVPTENGWQFRLPQKAADKCGLLPSIKAVTNLLIDSGEDALVPVPKVFEMLSLPPYGVREGLRPVILSICLAILHQRIALYEDGTYLHEVGGEDFLRLMKEPQAFHLQYCSIEGVRNEVFQKLLSGLQLSPRDPLHVDLLDLVRPLVVFISREIPEYARKTQNLPKSVIDVRRALIESREPVRLVFRQLPEACGFAQVSSKVGFPTDEAIRLAARVKEAMQCLQKAYPDLLSRVAKSIIAAFGVSGSVPIARQIIAGRASQLAAAVTEPTLKAFALRLADKNLAQQAWLESIGNLLAKKSPERWSDLDETEFGHQLEMASGRFKRTEFAIVGTTKKLNGHACRIALTRSDGAEVGELVDWNNRDEPELQRAREEIDALINRLGSTGLAATMQVLWERIGKTAIVTK